MCVLVEPRQNLVPFEKTCSCSIILPSRIIGIQTPLEAGGSLYYFGSLNKVPLITTSVVRLSMELSFFTFRLHSGRSKMSIPTTGPTTVDDNRSPTGLEDRITNL